MQKLIISTAVTLGLGIGSAGFAQESTDAPTDTPATETTTSAQDEIFPVAEDASNKIGTDFVKETHGDWQIICTVVPENQPTPCRMYQLLKDKDDSPVAEMSIVSLSKADKAVAGVNFITPLGTLLTAQVGMRIDSGQAKGYPFSWCEQAGCVTRFGLTAGELANLKKGNKAVMNITAVAAPKDPIALDLSLSGFTAGWDGLNKIKAEIAAEFEKTQKEAE